jgi:hypothetical protein
VKRYDGPGHNLDYASAMFVDAAGNVYVTGWSRAGSSNSTEEMATIKYNTNGTQMWVARYNGNTGDCHTFDHANAIIVDDAGNVYIAGEGHDGANSVHEDYITLKYNSSGVLQWARRYNGTATAEDMAYSIGLDASGNVYVTGRSCGSGMGYDIVTVKYNPAGVQQWAIRYNGPGNSYDAGKELVVDKSGNVYVTGTSKSSTGLDYVTIKYNTAGQQQWLQRYNGTANDTDAATGLDIDLFGNVYVTGYSKNTGTNSFDYITIRYRNSDGAQEWNQRYNAGGLDKAWDIQVTQKPCTVDYIEFDIPCWDIDVYVSGQSAGIGTSNDFVTIRYSEFGSQMWANRFNGPTNGSDASYSLSARDQFPIIYSAGQFSNDYGIIGITELRGPNGDFAGLSQNYPNPFNPETKILFKVEKETNVKIVIYDILGKTVATLVDRKYYKGTHVVSWNASNLNSGVYFYRYQTDYASETKKIVLVK